MEQIKWTNFYPELFQRFCNVLLSFEISKRFVPFSAQGRDGGIDGLFDGTYNGQSGKWRFQDKFHQGVGAAVVSRLKTDIREEVKKIKNEDVFILVTNVEITAAQRAELIAIGKAALSDQSHRTDIQIWDGAKLFTLYVKFPILRLWLEEGFTTAQLIKYEDYFAEQLSNGIEKANTFSNHIISRPEEFRQLTDFLDAPDKKFALITGEAGIGKTRLAVEFFKQKIDAQEDWEALVLQNHNITFDRLIFSLSGEKNYLILIDDVHTYSVAEIMDISKLAKAGGDKKIKFIFTASNIAWYDSFKLLSSHIKDQTVPIPLRKFSPVETAAFFQSELSNSPYDHLVPTLVEISNGRPILIVALLRAINQRISIPKIKEEGFLNGYVLGYFELVIQKINTESSIPYYKIQDAVRLICLVEPFEYHSEDLQRTFSGILLLQAEDFAFILKILAQEGLAVGKYATNIKPDYYSDIMLRTADEQWTEDKVEKLPQFLPNIIRNLASADEVKEATETGPSLLDSILKTYVRKLDGITDAMELLTIAKTIHSVAYLKPDIAVLFIDKLLVQMRLDGSQIQQEFEKYGEYHNNYPFGLMTTIRYILYDLLYFEDRYEYVFTSCLAIYNETADKQLFRNTWDYSLRDLLNGYQLKPQSYFVERANAILDAGEYTHAIFFVECFSELLKLEFRGTTTDGEGRAMVITTYYVPANPATKGMRKAIIAALIALHRHAEDESLRRRALYQILDVPRNILAGQRNAVPYPGQDEIETVLQYLRDPNSSFGSEEMKMVLTHLHRFKRWDKLAAFATWIDEIEARLMPSTLTEKLNAIILRADLSVQEDLAMVDASVREEFRRLIEENSGDELGRAVSAMFDVGVQPGNYFWPFLEVLPDTSVEKAKVFYTTLFQLRKDLIYGIGSAILRPLLLQFKEEEFYWASVKALEEDATEEARNVIFHLYAYSFVPEHSLGLKDIELLQRTFANRTLNNLILAGISLLAVLKADLGLFEKMAVQFLADCTQKAADRFFRELFQDRNDEFPIATKLLLNHTVRLSISYELEQCIIQIIQTGQFSIVFDYFIRRYRFLIDKIANKEDFYGYELVPLTVDNRFQRSFDENTRISMYQKVISWFVKEDFEEANLYFGKQLVQFFLVSKKLSEALDVFFRQFLDDRFKNKVFAERLTECLSQFEEKNERLIELVISYWKTGILYFSADSESLAQHYRACSFALWHVGSKMGRPGQPFKEDVRLKELLTEAIARYKTDSQAVKLLNDAMVIVDKAIFRDSAEREESW